MGAFFRSEKMVLCQLFLQAEAAYSGVSELGEIGLVQFRDLNQNVNAFQRKFVNELRRCEEMERKLRYVENEMNRDEVEMFDAEDNPRAPYPREMIDLEAEFEKIEGELKEVHSNSEALQRNFLELTELKEVLKVSKVFFQQHERDYQHFVEDTTNQSLTGEIVTQPGIIQLGFVAGVIQRERLVAFERLLWFACRGNAYLKTEEIPQELIDPVTGDKLHKSVFIIFFQGEQLKTRVKKICTGFKAILYPCPESDQERQDMLEGVSVRLEDLQQVLSTTQMHRTRVLHNAAKQLRHWLVKVRKIKAIYLTLDMCDFDMSPTNLVAEIWCPTRFMDNIREALQTATDTSGGTVPAILHVMETDEMPPTYNCTNKFTDAYQEIVNAYGIAKYQEVNPALFFTVTFPFLFSVMFGDAGHGVLMFLFGLALVVKEKSIAKAKIQSDIFQTFFSGRYVITLMGLFAVYSGLIYNDVYSKSVNIFGTSWHANFTDEYNSAAVLQMNVSKTFDTHNPYTFGIDPVWQLSKNKITFTNSFKMKLSVILGVTQMVFGIILSIFNYVQFNRKINIISQFLPEIIFLLSLFGYLISLFYFKWLAFDCDSTQEAPALLMHLMNMMMFKLFGSESSLPLSQREFYHYQKYVQAGFLMLTLACVPWLLFMNPCIKRSNYKQKKRERAISASSRSMLINNAELSAHDENVTVSDVSVMIHPEPEIEIMPQPVDNHVDNADKDTDNTTEGEFQFGEEMMLQLIHTIEFCLGCISHTASYLRLWALSLAHAELSEVLWTMVLRIGLGFDGWYGAIALVPLWGFWAVLTVAILLVMEGLSAFLHALRLHWIEFQTKFYVSDGYLFTPFTFKHLLDINEEVN